MLRYIESLRKQPKAKRNRYAFYGAVLVTLVVASAWVVTLPGRYHGINELPITTETTDDTMGGFRRAFGDLKNQMAAAILQLKETTTSPAVEPLPEGAIGATSTPYTLDVEAVFNASQATSRAASSASPTVATTTTPRIILIATTSATTTAPLTTE